MVLDSSVEPEALEPVAQTGPRVHPAAPQVAEVDMLIGRPELGPDIRTLVRAGEPVPARLVGRPWVRAVLTEAGPVPAPAGPAPAPARPKRKRGDRR
jgi:hypothetical protein